MPQSPGEAGTHAPEPAVAPPPGNPRFEHFDGIRGIAAIAVVTFHVSSLSGAVNGTQSGDTIAVLARMIDLFFLISGFLLYRPYALAHSRGERGPEPRRFARRRILRVIPAYWLALTLLAIYPGIPEVFSGEWWRFYFFLQAYSTDPGGLQVAWSLCVEAAYYILLPFWAWGIARLAAGRGGRRWLRAELIPLAAVALLGFGIQLLAARQEVSLLVGTSLLGQCFFLAMGMALAVASVATEDGERPGWLQAPIDRPGLCWIGAAACFFALTLILHLPGGILGAAGALSQSVPWSEAFASIFLTGLMVLLICLPAAFDDDRRGIPHRILRMRWLAWLGVISYGVYLWHLPIAEWLSLSDSNGATEHGIALIDNNLPLPTTPTLLLVTMAASVAVAAASYYGVERPFLKRKEPRRERRKRNRVSDGAGAG